MEYPVGVHQRELYGCALDVFKWLGPIQENGQRPKEISRFLRTLLLYRVHGVQEREVYECALDVVPWLGSIEENGQPPKEILRFFRTLEVYRIYLEGLD